MTSELNNNYCTEAIISLQNEFGGGLATAATGLHESCRHALAKLDSDKLTAGQAAARLKKRGFAVTAVELVDWFRANSGGRDPEWHHAGQLPKSYGGGMKKTYFFAKSLIAEFTQADFDSIVSLRDLKPVMRVAFYKSGRRFVPYATFVLTERIGKNDSLLTPEQFEALKPFNNEDLNAYETVEEFAARMGGAR